MGKDVVVRAEDSHAGGGDCLIGGGEVRAPFGSPLREATTTLPSAVCCPGIVGEAATILTASSPDRRLAARWSCPEGTSSL